MFDLIAAYIHSLLSALATTPQTLAEHAEMGLDFGYRRAP